MQAAKSLPVIQPNATTHPMPCVPAQWPQNVPATFHVLSKPSGPPVISIVRTAFSSRGEALPAEPLSHARGAAESLHPPADRSAARAGGDHGLAGGEPTLMGLDFYQRSIAYEHKYVVRA